MPQDIWAPFAGLIMALGVTIGGLVMVIKKKEQVGEILMISGLIVQIIALCITGFILNTII